MKMRQLKVKLEKKNEEILRLKQKKKTPDFSNENQSGMG
jgi:hypothetical protein